MLFLDVPIASAQIDAPSIEPRVELLMHALIMEAELIIVDLRHISSTMRALECASV